MGWRVYIYRRFVLFCWLCVYCFIYICYGLNVGMVPLCFEERLFYFSLCWPMTDSSVDNGRKPSRMGITLS
ncbi:hypothetical protein BDW62DRAFT_193508 [Aspergillus aurantiobrunneus]